MKNIAKFALIALCATMLAGCGHTIAQFDAYGEPPTDIQAASVSADDYYSADEPLVDEEFDDDGEFEVIEPKSEPAYSLEAEEVPLAGYDNIPVGTIVISTSDKELFFVASHNKGIRYPVAVGREGFAAPEGVYAICNMQEWPKWTPPPEMVAREPHLAKWVPDGMPGGPENPLGSRALYLCDVEGGPDGELRASKHDTLIRIHGTNKPGTIGTADSSGCFRMLNKHVGALYELASKGALVVVVGGDTQLAEADIE